MNIFRTFEIFLSEPISLLRNKLVQILHVESNIFSGRNFIDVNLADSAAQINVYNNSKVYSLLSLTLQKRKMNAINDKSKISNQL